MLNIVLYIYIRPFSLMVIINHEMKLVMASIIIATVCFIVYSFALIGENIANIRKDGFYFICCYSGQVYTTYWPLELVYLIVQTVPLYGIIIISLRNEYQFRNRQKNYNSISQEYQADQYQ